MRRNVSLTHVVMNILFYCYRAGRFSNHPARSTGLTADKVVENGRSETDNLIKFNGEF